MGKKKNEEVKKRKGHTVLIELQKKKRGGGGTLEKARLGFSSGRRKKVGGRGGDLTPEVPVVLTKKRLKGVLWSSIAEPEKVAWQQNKKQNKKKRKPNLHREKGEEGGAGVWFALVYITLWIGRVCQ